MLSINSSYPCKIGYYGSKRAISGIKYIVIHYTGNTKDTAVANAKYFHSSINRQASAHYFIDDNECYQSVQDNYVAWSVGGNVQSGHHPLYKICTNTNSISIEMCTSGNSEVSAKTEDNAVELVKYLMNKYSIDASHVVRHYDVNGKACPSTRFRTGNDWNNFLAKIQGKAITPSTPTPTPTPTVTPSSSSGWTYNVDSWVRSLQSELNKQYKAGLSVDGKAGDKTLAKCPTMKQGAKGNITKLVQQRLNSVGFNLSTDGIFGANTKKAVVVFQRNRGLSQDGIIGKNTWKWLLKGTRK